MCKIYIAGTYVYNMVGGRGRVRKESDECEVRGKGRKHTVFRRRKRE